MEKADKMTVFNLMEKLKSDKTSLKENIDLITKYPVLSYMVLAGKVDKMVLEIMRIIPEVKCRIVEDRLRLKTHVLPKEPKPGKCIRPAE